MRLVQAEPAADQHHLLGRGARLSLLYSNDFDGQELQGRSGGPRGSGPLATDADSMVPFHYRVVVDTVVGTTMADQTRAARFPTRREQPGGGEFYSWFHAYVVCRGGLVEADRLYAWTVHLPRALQLDARCSYYENRHVFAVGIENQECHLGLRFADDRTLVWVKGLGLSEQTIGIVPLGRAVQPGEALRFTAAVRWPGDKVAVSVVGSDGTIAVSTAPAVSLSRASVAVLASGGNTIGHDEDATLFCRLSQVRIHAVDPSPAIDDGTDDGDLVPPSFIHQT